ncbi:MAG: glycoside hydrolase family 3 N-terminal domain-containing protein, partial [Chloroflexota bacterium]
FTESPGAMALAASKDKLDHTKTVSRMLADEMCSLGINWTYAPVVDLSYNAENPTVGTRSFGVDPQQVGELAAQATEGFQAGGVVACAKHFPGLGNTSVDSHLDLPTLDAPLNQLMTKDLVPYQRVIDAGIASIMTTHTIYSTLDGEYPATLSTSIIHELLRDYLKFDGVIVTDCLEMHAITKHYGEGESSVLGLQADVDILLISHTQSHQETAFQAVEDAVANGRISQSNLDQAYERIMRIKEQFAIDSDAIDSVQVNTEAHQALALDSAKSAIALDGVLPSFAGKKIGVIEFASHKDSEVMERNDRTEFALAVQKEISSAEVVTLHALRPSEEQLDHAQALAEKVDVLVVATRNAHKVSAQHQFAQTFLDVAKQSVLVALRNPYDVDVIDAEVKISTFGESVPSLQAASALLAGQFQATGQRPATAKVN